MISVDTSAFILYFQDSKHAISQKVSQLLASNSLVLPPVVLSEMLSDPALPNEIRIYLSDLLILDILPDYWIRVGNMRRILLEKGLKCKLPDAMIAQSCLDYDIPILTGDYDFRHYVNHFNLKMC
jgi:predicted nucleic acid-binding protein